MTGAAVLCLAHIDQHCCAQLCTICTATGEDRLSSVMGAVHERLHVKHLQCRAAGGQRMCLIAKPVPACAAC